MRLKFFITVLFALYSYSALISCGNNNKPQKEQVVSSKEENVTKAPTERIAIDVGLVVADMEASLAFYNKLLGLSIVAQLETKLIGNGKMVQLKHGASILKLVEFEKQPPVNHQKGISSAVGIRYITLMVNTIDEFVSKMEQGQISVVMPLTELGNGAKILMVEDPDGNIVEFVQESGH